MKVVLTISRGATARNLLQNDFFELLKKEAEEIHILTPAFEDQRFKAEFGAANVHLHNLIEVKNTKADHALLGLHKYLIYNKTIAKSSRYGVAGQKVTRALFFKYILLKAIFLPLSKLRFLRKAALKIDLATRMKKEVAHYEKLFADIQPDLVFASSIIEPEDAAVLRAAKNKGIRTYGMAKTWDNPSKMYFRARADHVAVWSQFMKDQMMDYQDYEDEEITIVGVPQFDYYADEKASTSREDFFKRAKLNPKKLTILFGSEGKVVPTDPDIVEIIMEAVRDEKLPELQVFVRPHFAYKNDHKKFDRLLQQGGVSVDTGFDYTPAFRDQWDYSREQMLHFKSMIQESAIMINTASTLTLDAIALGRPVILINFDGHKKLPFHESVGRWYTTDYYSKIVESGAAMVVDSKEKLIRAIQALLDNPDLKKEEQDKLVSEFAYKIDGKAGRRLFDSVIKYGVY